MSQRKGKDRATTPPSHASSLPSIILVTAQQSIKIATRRVQNKRLPTGPRVTGGAPPRPTSDTAQFLDPASLPTTAPSWSYPTSSSPPNCCSDRYKRRTAVTSDSSCQMNISSASLLHVCRFNCNPTVAASRCRAISTLICPKRASFCARSTPRSPPLRTAISSSWHLLHHSPRQFASSVRAAKGTATANAMGNWTHLIRFIAKEDGQAHYGQVDATRYPDVGLTTYEGKEEVKVKEVTGGLYDGVVTDRELSVAQVSFWLLSRVGERGWWRRLISIGRRGGGG